MSDPVNSQARAAETVLVNELYSGPEMLYYE